MRTVNRHMNLSDNKLMKMRVYLLLFFSLCFMPASRANAQNAAGEFSASDFSEASLTGSFRELYLGMALDDLKSALMKDELFRFRGDRDVSFLPVREQTLVETTGYSYIRRAFFQLQDEMVFIMSFSLDTRLMDHYSVFTTFVNKYGQPVTLSPSEAVWETDETRVSIERPLTVKYIDKVIFNRLTEESRTGRSRELLRREEFLGDF